MGTTVSRVPQGEQLNPEGGVRGSVTNFVICNAAVATGLSSMLLVGVDSLI